MSGDVVERAAYEALAARYQGVIEAAVDAIIIIDEHGVIETFNPAAERIFGYGEAEVAGRNVRLLMPEPDASQHDSYMRRYLAGGAPHIIGIGRQVLGRRKSGEVFPLELGVGELAGLEPRRFVGTIRDISARQALEDALAVREQELRQLFEHAPIGVFAATLQGHFVQVNPALSSLVGYSAAELRRMSVSDLTLAEDQDVLQAAYRDVSQGHKAECRCELRWRRHDQAVIHVSLQAVAVAGDGSLVIGQILDRSEQFRTERESRDMAERLAQVGRVTTLGEMASAIAHEINQPLTAISAYAQACRRLFEQPAPDQYLLRETLEAITSQALRAGDVVRRIRGFVTHHDSARESVDINDVVRAALEFADFDLRAHAVEVKADLAARLPPVLVDPIQIQQVCLNLIRNAIDAMAETAPAVRRLSFTTHARGDTVLVHCNDSGPGVAAEMRERLFEPFQTNKAEGMGMGLSISTSIVNAHGGSLRYVDEPAGGGTFTLVLPAVLE
ncbi:MAG: PAS domain S-box protein [Gammaproteobacteria bacterium]